MKLIEIDLYSYFDVPKPKKAKGILYGYLPDNDIEVNLFRKRPAILSIPGGGYDFVSFREAEPICLRFLSLGYASFYLRYSVKRDGLHYPYPLFEAYMAKQYLHQEAKRLGIDKDKICSIGFSAGAHLEGLVNSITEEELNTEPFSLLKKDTVPFKACIFAYPVVSSDKAISHAPSFEALADKDRELTEKLSLEKRITSSFPPSFIWHTKQDSIVPYKNSLVLDKVFTTQGVDHELLLLEEGDHGESLADVNVYTTKQIKKVPEENHRWFDQAVKFLIQHSIEIED